LEAPPGLINRVELIERAQRGPDQGAGDHEIDRDSFQAGDESCHGCHGAKPLAYRRDVAWLWLMAAK
jgi:mono/diheme cytochrome c family protein